VVDVVEESEDDDAEEHPLAEGEPPPRGGGWLGGDRGAVHCWPPDLDLVNVKIRPAASLVNGKIEDMIEE
jgi:hypothetical protein